MDAGQIIAVVAVSLVVVGGMVWRGYRALCWYLRDLDDYV